MITTILKLDVGGQTFSTTLGTLTRDPSSKLAKLAYDRWLSTPTVSSPAPTTTPPSPTIFIDRDPTHFRHILNFLRDTDSTALPSSACCQNETALKELLREAEYYELTGLQQKICSILGGQCCTSMSPVIRTNCCHSDGGRLRVSPQQQQQAPSEWTPRQGEQLEWTEGGFGEFWTSVMEKITNRGYVDWLQCSHCDNDYEVRLPELPEVIYGCKNIKHFLLDMKGKLDSYVNETCVYVAWKNVYCGKDGYLDSVRFIMHVPLAYLKPYSQ